MLKGTQADIDKAKALLKEVGQVLQSAQKPEELDGLMTTLSNHRASDYQGSPQLAALHRQIQESSQIVGKWQEYLMAKESGNFAEQRSNLQQLSSALSSCPVIPRSTVLRLLSPQAPSLPANETERPKESAIRAYNSITAALAESGDIATAHQQLRDLTASRPDASPDSAVHHMVPTIENLRRLEPSMTEAEVIANVRTLNQNSQNRMIYNRALDQIILNSIARNHMIEVPGIKMGTPRKVVEKLAETAAKNQDFTLLRKALVTLENLLFGISGSDASKRDTDLKLLSLFELARAAEARNDVEAAAMAYVEASPLQGHYLSKELTYGKLADLKQKFPDKLEPILAKVEERRQRAEATKYAAELEARERMQRNMIATAATGRLGTSPERLEIRAMVQEVVADFLRATRVEAATQKPADAAATPTPDQKKPEPPRQEKR